MFIKNLPFTPPCLAYEKLRAKNSIFLESQKNGNFSYIALNPYLIFKAWGKKIELSYFDENNNLAKKIIKNNNPIKELKNILKSKKIIRKKTWPLFFGGAIGYFGYEAFKYFEIYKNLKLKNKPGLELPEIYLIFPKDILAFDHQNKILKVISENKKNLTKIEEKIKSKNSKKISIKNNKIDLKSNFSFEKYKQVVQKCQEYIKEGHSFQIKISQRFKAKILEDPWKIYLRLKKINPSPYAAYLELDDFYLISASPEHLLKVENNLVETEPIGGTYPRGKNKEEDKNILKKFKQDSKELSEHAMLIDLERNDLGRVCEFGTRKISEKMRLEKYSHLFHLVTKITGRLAKNKNCWDALEAIFPGGSITGCPKFRTMQIIDELEPDARGPYTGSIGFINFSEELDLNIIIRTLIMKDKQGYIQAGGGIVLDSNAKREYEETINKAKALFEAIS